MGQAYTEETSAEKISGGERDRRHVRTGLNSSNRTPVPRRDRDWTVVGRCEECRGPVLKMRRGADYAEQTEHRRGCSQRPDGDRRDI